NAVPAAPSTASVANTKKTWSLRRNNSKMAFSDSMTGADASKARWMRQRLGAAAVVPLLPLLALVFGCHRHDRASSGPRARPCAPGAGPRRAPRRLTRPPWGGYAITRGAAELWEERSTFTPWSRPRRGTGTSALAGPAEQAPGYQPAIDEKTLEPVSFWIWIE